MSAVPSEHIRGNQVVPAAGGWARVQAHPNYYMTKEKEKGVSKKAAEKDKKDTGRNEKELLERQRMRNNKGKNTSILKHALVRGLRRGIGLFINEVSFPSYRRCVQKLASKGKLAVVISDDSLAFGMNGELDELMAQQMSGRAGRRGLDTQGNIVYAGIRSSFTRRLMPEEENPASIIYPRYETMCLQAVLAPRHVGWNRAMCLGGKSLLEYRSTSGLDPSRYTTEMSMQTMLTLEFLKKIVIPSGKPDVEDVPFIAKCNVQDFPKRQELIRVWEKKFAMMQESIPAELRGRLSDPVVPGTELDGTFLQCLLDRAYIHTLPEDLKQDMKRKLWKAGEVFKREIDSDMNSAEATAGPLAAVKKAVEAFAELKDCDEQLLLTLLSNQLQPDPKLSPADNAKKLTQPCQAIAYCSFAEKPLPGAPGVSRISALAYVIYDLKLVSEEAVRWWCASPYTVLSSSLPTYREENSVLVPALSEEEVSACQKSCAAFIQWMIRLSVCLSARLSAIR
eukprot:gene25981-34581_t